MINYGIVLVPFPFDDFSASKVRPAVCLTREIGAYQHIVIAFISSRIPEVLLDSDFFIPLESNESKGTGLIKDSVIRLHKMVTIPKSLIKRKLGMLSKKSSRSIRKKIRRLFK